MADETTQGARDSSSVTIPAPRDTVTVNPADLSPNEAKALIETLRASPALYDGGDPQHGGTTEALERLYRAAYPDGGDVPSSVDKAAEEAFTPA